MGDFFANLGKMFSGEEPAAAPEGSTPVDVTDGAPAPISSAKGLNVTAEQIEGFAPDEVIAVLKAAISTSAGGTPAQNTAVIETCCKRLRVLCREPENCKKCDEAGTASAVVASMKALPSVPSVQLQALAALVNLCSGEANEHRKNAVEAGSMTAIVEAMTALPKNAEVSSPPPQHALVQSSLFSLRQLSPSAVLLCAHVQVQEMACIALQNCCYGEDTHALTRRQEAGAAGAIEAVVAATKEHAESAPMLDVGAATLRLIVHKVSALKTRAIKAGAKEEWVKPIAQGGGILSFRKIGFGTSRRNRD